MRELFQNDDDPDSGQQTFHNAGGKKAGKKSPLQDSKDDLQCTRHDDSHKKCLKGAKFCNLGSHHSG